MLKLRTGLVGCGDFGAQLGRYILRFADVVALCDIEPSRCASTAKALQITPSIHADYRRMFEAERLDAVFITAANFVHAEITIAAAQRGIHVFCEKAMARTVPECWAMVRACQEHKVKLMVGHKRRLRPPWRRLIELTRETGPLGPALSITVSQYADMRPYKIPESWWGDPALSGGFFWFLGVHVIDWFRAMCGNAKRVWGMLGPQHDPRYKCHDLINAVFQFESGALATITSSAAFPLHKFREAQGPMGQSRFGGFKMVPQLNYIDVHWQRLTDPSSQVERFDDLGFDHAYTQEVGDFIAWITRNEPSCLTWEEGLRCVELMEAAVRSANSGGHPVDLPLYPELEST